MSVTTKMTHECLLRMIIVTDKRSYSTQSGRSLLIVSEHVKYRIIDPINQGRLF